MEPDPAKLLEDAPKLPPEARAALAASLLGSLGEEADEDVEAARASEIAKRIQQLDSGALRPYRGLKLGAGSWACSAEQPDMGSASLMPLPKRRSKKLRMEMPMGRIEDLEQQVQTLSPEELAQFRAWFLEFDWVAWDQQIERDVRDGRLDRLAEKALHDHKSGQTTAL